MLAAARSMWRTNAIEPCPLPPATSAAVHHPGGASSSSHEKRTPPHVAQHGVPVREGAALDVLAGESDRLPVAQNRREGERLGVPEDVRGIEGYPEIITVLKLAHETVNFGGIWHSDTVYLPRPPMATLLLAREVPPYGGDTLFASMRTAYDGLDPDVRSTIDGLRVWHDYVYSRSQVAPVDPDSGLPAPGGAPEYFFSEFAPGAR